MAYAKCEDAAVKVSVVVPVYGVEAFVGRCAESLMQQTMTEGVEFLFVDDASTDGSRRVLADVLARYPERRQQVRLLTHEHNQGLPAARNTGLAAATGEYVFHCDGDDYVEPDMLEVLYREAKAAEADIVWCDWFLTFGANERYMKQPHYATPYDALRAMLSGAMKYNVWNKLARRALYTDHHIAFPAGHSMGEDMTMMMLFACAKNVAYVPRAFYHYVKLNTNAISHHPSVAHFEALRFNVQRLDDFVHQKFGNALDREIAFLKLEAKFPFLILGPKGKMYDAWKEWYPEANAYIWENKQIPWRNRCLQWLAAKGQFWAVWLYCKCVLGFVYGVIFR